MLIAVYVRGMAESTVYGKIDDLTATEKLRDPKEPGQP
jgi:hypothetical protein